MSTKIILVAAAWILLFMVILVLYFLRDVSPMKEFIAWVLMMQPILWLAGAGAFAFSVWVIRHDFSSKSKRKAKDGTQPTEGEKSDLKIVVRSATTETYAVYDPNPRISSNLFEVSPSPLFQKKTDVAVTAKFTPTKEIKIKALTLHIERNFYDARALPATVIDRKATYTIVFDVPPHIVEQAIKSKSRQNYIQLVVCLLNEFTIPQRPMWPPGLPLLPVEED